MTINKYHISKCQDNDDQHNQQMQPRVAVWNLLIFLASPPPLVATRVRNVQYFVHVSQHQSIIIIFLLQNHLFGCIPLFGTPCCLFASPSQVSVYDYFDDEESG